ncbi:hypothetical protein J6590_044180 [Homalodisca vitripennis]|nr:hypothetical protein J6590_044180 [Homalodisca vitripennis]
MLDLLSADAAARCEAAPLSDNISPGPIRELQPDMGPAIVSARAHQSLTSFNVHVSTFQRTRTKDKYRVVYTDHQRLELEKEFHYSRYITIRRKAELATNLGLSERQVKIWFQNRRAKERKQLKKREELLHKEKMQQLAML